MAKRRILDFSGKKRVSKFEQFWFDYVTDHGGLLIFAVIAILTALTIWLLRFFALGPSFWDAFRG